jgi:hypothetical protein
VKKDIYTGDYKTPVREIKYPKKWTNIPFYGLEDSV